MAKHETFKASSFVPTPFSTAGDKARFVNQFIKFVESDYSPNAFPKWFYIRLSMTFGHIAHYNQDGFYETFFSSLQGRLQFAKITEAYERYGDPHHTFSDAEKVIQDWARSFGMVIKAQSLLDKATEARDRALYESLKARFDPAPNPEGQFNVFHKYRAVCMCRGDDGFPFPREQFVYAVNLETATRAFSGASYFLNFVEAPKLADDLIYDDKGNQIKGEGQHVAHPE